jgi:transcriptional antiterminator NusG
MDNEKLDNEINGGVKEKPVAEAGTRPMNAVLVETESGTTGDTADVSPGDEEEKALASEVDEVESEHEEELPPEEIERLIELRVADPERPDMLWYVVHTLTGHEEKVKTSLLKSAQDSDLEDYFDEVLVPTEEVTKTTKKGKKTSRKVFFPGYILIRMVINEKTWALVRGTPGVTGFVKTGTHPVQLTPDEIRVTLDQIEGRKPRVEYVVDFEPGESVKITSGPFANFTAVVEDVYPERQKIKVLVTVFGRATSTELELSVVEKAL